MSISSKREAGDPARERTPAEEAAVRAVQAWVNQLARTLKTCRLYDGNNPTVVRFREEAATSLARLLEEMGPLRLQFTNDDVRYEDASLYPARSRDDNLALPFYHDGIHSLTFSPGITGAEVDALLDALLQVTGQNVGQDDLVTLLWEAHLDHVDMDYVPSEGDVGSGDGPADTSEGVPWPTGAAETPEDAPPVATEAPISDADQGGNRSDDWAFGHSTVEIEATFTELEAVAAVETVRFHDECEAEHKAGGIHGMIAVVRACLAAGANRDDAVEFARFLPRLLRQAISQGDWTDAREAMELLERCGSPEWSVESFVQELLQPISVSAAVAHLDLQGPEAIAEFVALAKAMGDPALDWLLQVLGESQQRRTRRVIAEAVGELCRDNPERLAPWLSDPRWYVVRNVVHILAWIGGPGTVGLLRTAARHPEIRVRQEVVAALGQVEGTLARPVLLGMLEGADARMFSSVLHQLSAVKDHATARVIVSMMQEPAFEARPIEEKRAIYSAVSAVGGDEILADLDAEMHKGGWFNRAQDQHRQAVARCIARIGTPAARALLEEGARSKRAPLRKACEDALGGVSPNA